MRTIYVTTRKVEEFYLSEGALLEILKKVFSSDMEIQLAKSLDDIEDVEEAICEASEFLPDLGFVPRKTIDSSVTAYTDYSEAYEDMEWGIH